MTVITKFSLKVNVKGETMLCCVAEQYQRFCAKIVELILVNFISKTDEMTIDRFLFNIKLMCDLFWKLYIMGTDGIGEKDYIINKTDVLYR